MSQTGSSATYSYIALRGTPTREGATLLGSTEVHDRAPSSSTSRTAPVAALAYQQTGDQGLVALLAQLQARVLTTARLFFVSRPSLQTQTRKNTSGSDGGPGAALLAVPAQAPPIAAAHSS